MDTEFEIIRDRMVADWGLADLPRGKQDEFIERIGSLIYHNVVDRCLDSLSDEDRVAFDTLLNTPSSDAIAIMDFLRKHIDTFEIILVEETKKLQKETANNH